MNTGTSNFHRGTATAAEDSNTSRHLAGFWMIEPEIAFADLPDNAALAEALLKYTFAALLNGIDDQAIVIIALYVDGSERVRNQRMELATPDLDLIKQAEQGGRDRRGRFAKSRSGNPADGRRITPMQSPSPNLPHEAQARRSAGR